MVSIWKKGIITFSTFLSTIFTLPIRGSRLCFDIHYFAQLTFLFRISLLQYHSLTFDFIFADRPASRCFSTFHFIEKHSHFLDSQSCYSSLAFLFIMQAKLAGTHLLFKLALIPTIITVL